MILVIDASNIRAGGGLTHLAELLKCIDPTKHPINKVLLYAPFSSLIKIPDYGWLEKKTNWYLNQNFITRIFWQEFILPQLCRRKADLLFSLGGTYVGSFHPYISMSQNMLVFDRKERNRYGISFQLFRISLLEKLQKLSFKNADGVLFISKYAQKEISKVVRIKNSTVIPHGISDRFKQRPRLANPISNYNFNNPLKILYVSIIDVYKHQWNVVKAVENLRNEKNLPVELHLVGPHYLPSYKLLLKTISSFPNSYDFIKVHGKVPFEQIQSFYKSSDIFVFASTCENMPNIVLEAMSAGLPICSSNSMPMPEFLLDAAEYFDANIPRSIRDSLVRLINSPSLRDDLSERAYKESEKYSWERCSSETIEFLSLTLDKFRQKAPES